MSQGERPPLGQLAFFLIVVSTGWLGGHAYIGWRTGVGLGLSSAFFWIVVFAPAATTLAILVGTRSRMHPTAVRLRNAAWLYFGSFTLLLPATGIGHALHDLVGVLGIRPDGFATAVTGLALGLTAAITTLAAITARRPVPLVEVEVPIDDLHPDLDGYRIVQLCDVHVGAPATAADLAALVATANTAGADMVAFVGDLVDGRVKDVGDHVTALGDLEARDGAYFVTGNHEYYSGARSWARRIEELGLTVLTNQGEAIHVGDASLWIAGVTDITAHQFVREDRSDPAAAVMGSDTSDLVVLLAHQPNSIHEASQVGVDLQLSGHTHGGQYLPWTWTVGWFNAYVRGLHKHDGTWIYVSCGSGMWGPPMRLGAPCEVTAITLRRVAT